MSELEIAILKDKILQYLNKHSDKTIYLNVIRNDLKLSTLPEGVLNACIESMDSADIITCQYEDHNGAFLRINDKGKLFLISGGYAKPIQDKLNDRRQQEADKQKARELTELNIKNLKRAKWFSIIAIIISLAALAVSILNTF
jgi:hypothetical protein